MKKILSMLAVVAISGTAATSVVSCAAQKTKSTTKNETDEILNVISEYKNSYPFEMPNTQKDLSLITREVVQVELIKKLKNKIGFDDNKFFVQPIGFTPIVKQDNKFSNGSFKFEIINSYTKDPVADSQGQSQFTIYYSTYYTDTLNELSKEFATHSQANSAIELGLTTTPIKDVLSVFAAFVGSAVPDFDFMHSLSSFFNFTLMDLLAIFSADEVQISELISLTPTVVPSLMKDAKGNVVIDDKDPNGPGAQWNAFYALLDKFMVTLLNSYLGKNYQSLDDVKFGGIDNSNVKVNQFNMHDIITAIAPDIVHMMNFYRNDLQKMIMSKICDTGWMILRYLMMPSGDATSGQYYYNDGFDKINQILVSGSDKTTSYQRISVSNLDNIMYDMFGYNTQWQLEKPNDAGWIDATDHSLFMKPPVEMMMKKPTNSGVNASHKDDGSWIYVPAISKTVNKNRGLSGDGTSGEFMPTVNFANLAIEVLNGSIKSSDISVPLNISDPSKMIFGDYDENHRWDWAFKADFGYNVDKMVYPSKIWDQIMKAWVDISYYDQSVLDFHFDKSSSTTPYMISIEYQKVNDKNYTKITDFEDLLKSDDSMYGVASWRFSGDMSGNVVCINSDTGTELKGLNIAFKNQKFNVYLR